MGEDNLRTVTLRGVCFHANFCKSESTLWDEWRAKHKTKLRANDAVLFVSASRDQCLFVTRIGEVDALRARARVLDSRRWRIVGGTWNPDMLQNYAHEVGLHFAGIKRFEELYAERRLRKMLESA